MSFDLSRCLSWSSSIRVGLGLAGMAIVACSDGGAPTGPAPGSSADGTYTYATDVQGIWNRNCGPACHGLGGNGGLDLRPGASHAQLVGTVSPNYGAPRIAAGDPAGSVLFGKITDSGVFGGSMPAGGPALNSIDIELIENWILAGAPAGAFDAPEGEASSKSVSSRPEVRP